MGTLPRSPGNWQRQESKRKSLRGREHELPRAASITYFPFSTYTQQRHGNNSVFLAVDLQTSSKRSKDISTKSLPKLKWRTLHRRRGRDPGSTNESCSRPTTEKKNQTIKMNRTTINNSNNNVNLRRKPAAFTRRPNRSRNSSFPMVCECIHSFNLYFLNIPY